MAYQVDQSTTLQGTHVVTRRTNLVHGDGRPVWKVIVTLEDGSDRLLTAVSIEDALWFAHGLLR